MTNFADSFPTHKTPEHPPAGPEESGDKFDELLARMIDLTSTEGGVSAVSFVERTVEEADEMGLELDDEQLGRIVGLGFGPPEQVIRRISEISEAQFDEVYPGTIGELLIEYVTPPGHP